MPDTPGLNLDQIEALVKEIYFVADSGFEETDERLASLALCLAEDVPALLDALRSCREKLRELEQRDYADDREWFRQRLAECREEASKLREARDDIEKLWRADLDEADRVADDGGHVGVASYYRNKARGFGEALNIIDAALGREAG